MFFPYYCLLSVSKTLNVKNFFVILMSSSDILEGVNPNRMELLELRKRALLAKHGYSILKEKMDALIIEFYTAISETKEAQKQALSALAKSHRSLAQAMLQMSPMELESIAEFSTRTIEIHPTSINIMGVKVAKLNMKVIEANPATYSIYSTTPALEDAIIANREAVKSLINYAEKMATLQRLAIEINETKRRVNALNHTIIPRLENTANYIMLVLQEQERENFTRLKHIKKKMSEVKEEQLVSLET